MKLETFNELCKGLFDFRTKIYQRQFGVDCINKKRVIGVFCRQSGKSETMSKVAVLRAFKYVNHNVLIFAPTDRQTGLLALKIDASLKKMPYLQQFHVVRQTQREFYFSNGSSIICETTGDSGENIRGYTAHTIILEEAGSIKDSIIQNSILPMGATTDATIIKIGTPRGKNHFFESSRDLNYVVHTYGWKYPVETKLISEEYINEMRNTMPDITFRTEYNAEFIEDEDAFFRYDLIESCKETVNTEMPSNRYYLGADIARLGRDSTALIIINIDIKGVAHVVEIVEMRKSTLDVTIEKIEQLHQQYKFTRIFIDETGLGAGVTDVLSKKLNQPKIHKGAMMTGFPSQKEYGDKVIGIRFTIKSKLDMFSNLSVLMQQSKIKYPPHPKLIAQLRDFRYERTEADNVKLHHSDNGFDDFVDSLALACKEVNTKQIGYAF